MASIFNSWNTEYKSPFGAATAGEELRFAIKVPKEVGCKAPRLFLEKDGEAPVEYAMARTPGEEKETATDNFSLALALPEPGLYFYWFDLWIDFKKLYKSDSGEAVLRTEPGEKFAQTVYDADFSTPDFEHGGVMYQIFPDRFYEGDPDKERMFTERIYREDKHNEPYFWGEVKSYGSLTQDYYGGDLCGIEKRLPFLASLGVTLLYLNPIFEAHSNHRYNTADYFKVDPYLGTNEDFSRLCKTAEQFGIRIILDGVFSHTGADSVYFNKEGRYPSVGAWQGPQSPYRSWYHFLPNGDYESWWGFETLPACNKQNREFRNFIAGEGGVVDFWINLGAAGFRLDVADELPDDFIEEIRTAVKRHGTDKLLLGEVWEDAATKEAYGVRRKYFLGHELDGVMNYPFRTAILRYLQYFSASAFKNSIMSICEHYPAPALAACTNHISTHDTVRAITALVGDAEEGHDRNWQSGRKLSPEQYHMGIVRMRLAFVLQFTLPGVPCVYYGDEIAMQGYSDPFNRAYYDWNSGENRLIPLMIQLSNLRRHCPAFSGGSIRFVRAKNGVVVFERTGNGEKAAVAVNCSGWPAVVNLLGDELTVPMMDFAIRTTNYDFDAGPEAYLDDPVLLEE